MEGAKKEGSNQQVIELAWFISNLGLKIRQFFAGNPALDSNLQSAAEK